MRKFYKVLCLILWYVGIVLMMLSLIDFHNVWLLKYVYLLPHYSNNRDAILNVGKTLFGLNTIVFGFQSAEKMKLVGNKALSYKDRIKPIKDEFDNLKLSEKLYYSLGGEADKFQKWGLIGLSNEEVLSLLEEDESKKIFKSALNNCPYKFPEYKDKVVNEFNKIPELTDESRLGKRLNKLEFDENEWKELKDFKESLERYL